jgi:hypothetical protein
LSSIGAIQRQAQRGIQQLAMQEEQAQEMNRRAFEGAARMSAAERTKQFASEQEKEQLKTNVQLEKLAARRAAIGQGLSGITSAATGLAMSGLGGGPGKDNVDTGLSASDVYTRGSVVRQPASSRRTSPSGILSYRTGGF